MKAIETNYKGYRFRSRLEARWAVFFDALGLQWEYEPQGFDLDDAGWYLPDFWLSDYKAWIEIKGDKPTFLEIKKMDKLFWSGAGGASAGIILHGVPGENQDACRWLECANCSRIAIGIVDDIMRGDERLVRVTALMLCDHRNELQVNTNRLLTAFQSAKQARFEHGESPVLPKQDQRVAPLPMRLLPPPSGNLPEKQPEFPEPEPQVGDLTWWQQHWVSFREHMERRDAEARRLAIGLKFSAPIAASFDSLTLGFAYTLHKEKIERAKEEVGVELSKFVGRSILVNVVMSDSDEIRSLFYRSPKSEAEEAVEQPVARLALRAGWRIDGRTALTREAIKEEAVKYLLEKAQELGHTITADEILNKAERAQNNDLR